MTKNLRPATITIVGLIFFAAGFVFQGTNEVFLDFSKILGLIFIVVGAVGIFRKNPK